MEKFDSIAELIKCYEGGYKGAVSMLNSLYECGNASGEGEPVGEEYMTPLEAAQEEEFDILGDLNDCNNSVVVRISEGEYAVICDCWGPWMVLLTEELLEEAQEEERDE